MGTVRKVVKLGKAVASAADVLNIYVYDTDCPAANGDAAFETNCPTCPVAVLTREASTFILFLTPVRPFHPLSFVLVTSQACLALSASLSIYTWEIT